MEKMCELFENCAFFKKYSQIMNRTCQGFIEEFCRGGESHKCKRKIFREKEGKAPPEDMLPI